MMNILESEIRKLRFDIFIFFDKEFYLWALGDNLAFSFKKKKWTDESLILSEYDFIWYEKTVKQS